MAGKVFRYDCYDLRKFKPGDISTFIDIGANIGSVSLMAKVLNPTARVIALEPCEMTFNKLTENMAQWMNTGIECYNVALGDGSDLCLAKKHSLHNSGLNKFYAEEEKQWWPSEDREMAPSKSLADIFKDYDISVSEPYIIKIDSEGGERFLLQQQETIDLVRGSVQAVFEIHLGFGGTGEQWREWIQNLSDTHELRIGQWEGEEDDELRKYRYIPHEDFLFTKKNHAVELINRDWVGPWPGRGM